MSRVLELQYDILQEKYDILQDKYNTLLKETSENTTFLSKKI
jgi:hypothetical protein